MAKVSVILPVFNAEKYLAPAVASILMQDHRDLEIIAVNDGSSDRSGEILQRAAAQDPRIVVIARENRGLIATLNEALGRATGDFIARMDADDISYPNRISTQLKAFASDPELAVSGCFFDTIYAGRRMLPPGAPDATEAVELRVLSRFCTILRHPTVMFRRSTIPDGELRYDEAYPIAEDFDLFRRLADCCKVAQTVEPLLAYRLHPDSVSVTRMTTMWQSHVRIVEEGLLHHYPAAAGTGFGRIAEEVTADTVACAAGLIRKLDAMEHDQPTEEYRAFCLGVDNLFYFQLGLICDTRNYAHAWSFIDQCNRWHKIRRRERPMLRLSRHAPGIGVLGFAAVNASLRVKLRMISRDMRDVVPSLGDISALADSFDVRPGEAAAARAYA